MKKSHILIILIPFLTGCTKSTDLDKLIGSWEDSMDIGGLSLDIIYTFKVDGTYIQENKFNTGVATSYQMIPIMCGNSLNK